MELVAFDIDGVLTTREGLTEYKQFMSRDNTTLGVVSARNRDSIDEFIEQSGVKTDFRRSSKLKGITLMNLSDMYNPDEKVYYGSWAKDRVQALLAGWEYKQL